MEQGDVVGQTAGSALASTEKDSAFKRGESPWLLVVHCLRSVGNLVIEVLCTSTV